MSIREHRLCLNAAPHYASEAVASMRMCVGFSCKWNIFTDINSECARISRIKLAKAKRKNPTKTFLKTYGWNGSYFQSNFNLISIMVNTSLKRCSHITCV